MVGKIHFGLEAGGQTLGSIHAENWRAWNFRIEDAAGTEIARITKTCEGSWRKAMFTTADNYVVQLHVPLPQTTAVVGGGVGACRSTRHSSRTPAASADGTHSMPPGHVVRDAVARALAEDLGPLGDLTAALVPDRGDGGGRAS